MPEHASYHDDEIVNVETHHERSDVNVRALIWSVAIFIVFAVLVHFIVLAMFRGFRDHERRNVGTGPLTSVARPPDANVPAEPRLQPFPGAVPPYGSTPPTDMVLMHANEDKVLNHYGWVDAQKGVVHIPIEDAKKLALQRGVFRGAAPASGA